MLLFNVIPVVATLCSVFPQLSFSREVLIFPNHTSSHTSPDAFFVNQTKFHIAPSDRAVNEPFNILEFHLSNGYDTHNISGSSSAAIPIGFDAVSHISKKAASVPAVYLQEGAGGSKGENRNNTDIVPLVPYLLQNFLYPLLGKLYGATGALPSISAQQNYTLD